MSVNKIIESSGPQDHGIVQEKQLTALQFIKKIKTSSDRPQLVAELAGLFTSDRETAMLIFDQLIHGDQPLMRRFAISFFESEKAAELVPYLKRLVLIEDDIENLKLCVRCVSGKLDRSELPEYFEAAAAGKSAKEKEILAFLERECRFLSVDYARMIENANIVRRQARDKRLEKYEKKKIKGQDEIVIADMVAEGVRNPKTLYYAASVIAVGIVLFAAIHIYGSFREGNILAGSLALIDEYNEAQAIASLSAASFEYPASIGILAALHRLYCENYMIVEANDILNRMLNLRSDSPELRVAEIRNAMFAGDLKSAADFFSKNSAEIANSPEGEFLKIQYEYMSARTSGSRNRDEMKRIFESALRFGKKSVPGFRPYCLNISITLAAEGDLVEEGKPFYNTALEIKNPDPKTLLACAYYLEVSGNLDEALNYYDGVVKARPAQNIYDYACIRAGSLSSKLSKHVVAARYFSKWRDSRPDSLDPLLSLLQAYGDAGDVGGFNSIYSEAVEKFRDEPLVYYNYGVIKMKTGAFEEAIKNFSKALSLKPDLTEANYNIAKSLVSLSEKFEAHSAPWNQYMVEAISYYKKCIVLDPNYEPAHISLGIISLSKNPPDYNSASESFSKALKINPVSKDALLNLLSLGYLKNDKTMIEKYRNEIFLKFKDDHSLIEKMRSFANTKRLND